MIGFIKGEVVERGANWLLVTAGSIGYKIFVTAETLLSAEAGRAVTLFCHHHFSRDQQSLYGFASRAELDLFELMLTISGIGPKGALSILSKAKSSEIERAIAKGDANLFTAMAGVGKKKADHIILELQPKLAGQAVVEGAGRSTTRNVIVALEGLGYRRDEIIATLRDMPDTLSNDSERIKWALRNLYR